MSDSKVTEDERDPFIWPYRGGTVGPMGNSPKDLRDQERLLNAVKDTEVVIVPNGNRINVVGVDGIATQVLLNLDDWQ